MARAALVCMIFIILFASVATTQAAAEKIITVDQSGRGNYSKIQDAIDSVMSNNTEPVTISVNPGIYKETITVPQDKPNITLTGSTKEASDVIITWDQKGDISGTNPTATFHVNASDFIARYVTFENTYGKGAQAVALRVSGDRAAFYNCSITGYQDTLFEEFGRHYYDNCYIEGVTDFIFGSATSFFQSCHIHSREGGYITAPQRESAADPGGFVFFNGRITGEGGKTCLGRPWVGSYARVIFIYTNMDDVLKPQGWDHNHQSEEDLRKNSFCGQFKCYGPGATTSKRVKWAREFSEQEIEPYLTTAFINGNDWLKSPPVTHSPPPSSPPQMNPSAPKPEKHLPPPAPVVIPSSPPQPPPPVVIPSSPPLPPVVIPSPPPSKPVIPWSAPPAPVTAAPPPSAGRVIVTPWSGISKDEGGEPIIMYYTSGVLHSPLSAV